MNKFVIVLICVLVSSFANAKTGGHGSGGHNNISARGQDVVYAAQSAKFGLELPVGPVGSVHR